jgi:multidrug efflux pump subunit AcrB
LLLIYTILATSFRSYVQPLIIMSTLPFGLVGAVLGHMLMGHALTLLSLLGIVALSGVVVNDTVVLLDAVNRAVRSSTSVVQAVLSGSQVRFRAIILTTLTTIAGLLPLLAEKSLQAQFLIPIAISMSFGLMVTSVLTLLLVPALYLLLHDLRRGTHWLLTGSWLLPEEAAVAGVAGTSGAAVSGDGRHAETHAHSGGKVVKQPELTQHLPQ